MIKQFVTGRAELRGTKPECPLFSVGLGPRSLSYSRFEISGPRNRVGMVNWEQRRRVQLPGTKTERNLSTTLSRRRTDIVAPIEGSI